MPKNHLTMEVVDDPDVIARSRAQLERFKRNNDWLKSQSPDLLPQVRGKHLVVAGQEAFIADSIDEAWTIARAAHPDDDSAFGRYTAVTS